MSARLVPSLLLVLLVAGPAFAAPFRARLLHPDGRPAAGYVVSVVGGTLTVPTAPDGTFVLDPAPRPPFLLIASGPEGEISAPLVVAEVEAGAVDLTLEAVAQDSVTVVSGIAPGLDLLPASAAVVVSSEALEQRPPQRVADALEVVAGASKLGEGADSVPVLRGLARGRTLLLVDGARVTAERRAGPSATFLDPATLGSLEVLRGPGSVVYGSDAFGGVIQATTRDPEPQRSASFALDAASGGQSQLGGSAWASLPLGTGALLVSAHATSAGDARAAQGDAIFNSSFSARGGALRYSVPLGVGRLRASVQLDRVTDLGKAAIDSREVRAFYPRESSDRLVLSWIGAPGGVWDSIDATFFYGTYRIALDRDRVPTATSSRRIDSSDTDARDGSLRVLGGRALGGGRLQAGLDVYSRFGLSANVGRLDFAGDGATVVRNTTSVAIDDARQLDGGVFATWTRPLAEAWSLGLGLRGDRIETRNSGGFFGDRSRSSAALSGNAALTWAAQQGWSVTGQLARGFRSPTLSDRYFRGPSGRGFATGNPELDPETSLQLDLAVRHQAGRTATAVYAYRYEIADLIERYQEGADFFFRNRGKARLVGLELESQTALSGGWALDAGAAWTRARADSGEPIDDSPAPYGWLGARRDFAQGYVFTRLAAHLAKHDPGPTEVRRPGYLLLDLGGGWRFAEGLELRLALRNALDRDYSGSPDETADRSPGRAWVAGLSGRF